jgi:hypothetical protein
MSSSWLDWIQARVRSAGDRIVTWLNENNIEVQVEYYDGNQRYRRIVTGPNRQQEAVVVNEPIFQSHHPLVSGLTDEQIENSCAMVEYTPSPNQSQCTICMEDFQPKESVRILPCFHQYHAECIDTWLHEHAECPICKHSLLQ